MKERVICFSHGLSRQDIEKGESSFYSLNSEAPVLDVIAVSESMLDLPVGEALGNLLFGSGFNEAEEQRPLEINSFSGDKACRVVVVHAQEREQVLQVMRSFKAVLPEPQTIIFAVITETAMSWAFKDYIGHLVQEHEHMKSRRPEDNPDMKKM